jgi:hypothetical protein
MASETQSLKESSLTEFQLNSVFYDDGESTIVFFADESLKSIARTVSLEVHDHDLCLKKEGSVVFFPDTQICRTNTWQLNVVDLTIIVHECTYENGQCDHDKVPRILFLGVTGPRYRLHASRVYEKGHESLYENSKLTVPHHLFGNGYDYKGPIALIEQQTCLCSTLPKIHHLHVVCATIVRTDRDVSIHTQELSKEFAEKDIGFITHDQFKANPHVFNSQDTTLLKNMIIEEDGRIWWDDIETVD